MSKAKKVPNPGSDAALELGCTCPVVDNGHGKGCGYGKNMFWHTAGCPVHHPNSAQSRKVKKT